MPRGWEWLVVLGIILLLFGATKLPALARSLGKSAGEFKKGLKEGSDEAKADAKKEEADKPK
ncbi:MAG: twin-arginine translocase TatA/TatE family subunit [Planctomycetes bacterium]|nr:twin-arginine translocase TatA/TatE family subunit [Planctomycetota bacterium]